MSVRTKTTVLVGIVLSVEDIDYPDDEDIEEWLDQSLSGSSCKSFYAPYSGKIGIGRLLACIDRDGVDEDERYDYFEILELFDQVATELKMWNNKTKTIKTTTVSSGLHIMDTSK